MTVVTGTIVNPDGSPATGSVVLQLAGENGRALSTGFVDDQTIVGASTAELDENGEYSIDVPATADISPTGTRWARSHGSGRSATTIYLDVPADGPVSEEDIVSDPPASVASPALSLHAATTLEDGAHGRIVRPVVSIEAGFLDRLAERKAAAANRPFRMIGFGDSLGVGYYASDFLDNGYMRLIGDALQAELGDGGSGWINSAWASFFFMPGASGQWATTGAWTAALGGPGWVTQRPTVAGNGATITTTVRGTTIDMVQRRGSGFGSWTYSIDGASAVSVSAANATADVHTTTVTGLAPGDHQVVITATTGDCRIAGIRGRNDAGVCLDNYSIGSAAYVNPTASLHLLRAAEGISGATTLSTTIGMHDVIDVAVLGLGVNDALDTEIATAGLETVLHTLWDALRRKGPDGEPPLIVVILPHVGKHDDADTSPEYPRVAATLRTWASSIGAAVVDVWAEGRRSWDYFDSLDAWGELSPGSPDTIHLSDTGHELTAASTIDLLTGSA